MVGKIGEQNRIEQRPSTMSDRQHTSKSQGARPGEIVVDLRELCNQKDTVYRKRKDYIQKQLIL